jgi:hypothetical protein
LGFTHICARTRKGKYFTVQAVKVWAVYVAESVCGTRDVEGEAYDYSASTRHLKMPAQLGGHFKAVAARQLSTPVFVSIWWWPGDYHNAWFRRLLGDESESA